MMDLHGQKHVVELFVKLNHYKTACSCIIMNGINNNNNNLCSFHLEDLLVRLKSLLSECFLSECLEREDYTLYFNLTMALLVEALHYKSEGCGFHSQWGHLDFSGT
jgi:hypothetical protein